MKKLPIFCLFLCFSAVYADCIWRDDIGYAACTNSSMIAPKPIPFTPDSWRGMMVAGLKIIASNGRQSPKISQSEAILWLKEIGNITVASATPVHTTDITHKQGSVAPAPTLSRSSPAYAPVIVPSPKPKDCSNPRMADWDSYIAEVFSQGVYIDPYGSNQTAKNEILDRIAQGHSSFQWLCKNG